MSYPTVAKTYTLEPPTEKDVCCAHVMRSYSSFDGYDEDEDICGTPATYVVSIKTVTVKGKLVHNRQGFCSKHWKRKYGRWFKTDVIYTRSNAISV